MNHRLLFLLGLCVLVATATTAFGAEPTQAPWITREGAVAMLVESRANWKAEVAVARAHPEPVQLYVDTDANEWYIPYLEVAFKHGLIEATDFHREFHPGELLRVGDAVALAARYKANGDRSKLPQEEPDHPLSIPLHVQAAYDMGLQLPSPLHTWDDIRRTAWFDLIESAGVHAPSSIAVRMPTIEPVQQLPVTGPAVLPVMSQPVVQQPVSQSVVSPTASVMARPTSSQFASSPTSAYVSPYTRPVSSDNRSNYPSPADPSDGYFAIAIPSLGISDLKISHPTDVTTQQGLLAPLQSGVGHLFGYPGNGGTILVYGHSSSYSWDVSEYTKIFRKINALKPGDKVYIAYQGKTFAYEVTYAQTVAADDMSAYQKNNGEELILYTCWPPDDVKQRYLVHAKPV